MSAVLLLRGNVLLCFGASCHARFIAIVTSPLRLLSVQGPICMIISLDWGSPPFDLVCTRCAHSLILSWLNKTKVPLAFLTGKT